MLVAVTYKCNLECPHCMQNAGPDETEFMTYDTFYRTMKFADAIGSTSFSITGGEPFLHPEIEHFTKEALGYLKDQLTPFGAGFVVMLLSNGTFLKDREKVEFVKSLKAYQRFSGVQVTTYKGIYTNYADVTKPHLRAVRDIGYKRCILEIDPHIRFHPLGRAAQGKYFEISKSQNVYPSCTNVSLVAAQFPQEMSLLPGFVIEKAGMFCHPLVSPNGDIHMGESRNCKVIGNVWDDFAELKQKMSEYRPCGKCAAYKWHFDNPDTEKDKAVVALLNGIGSLEEIR